MKFRPIIFAWLLLLAATLAMGGGAWWLLGREADRVENLAEGALTRGAATVAENVNLLADEIKLSVSDGLLAARNTPDPRASLAELVANNPFVSAGIYFRSGDAVTVWYGERGTLPAPNSLVEGLPWSVAGAKDNDLAVLPEADYGSIFKRENQLLDESNVQLEKKAPTDVVEEARLEMAPAPLEPESQLEQSEVYLQQRSIVSKLNRDVQAAVNNLSGTLAPAPAAESEELVDGFAFSGETAADDRLGAARQRLDLAEGESLEDFGSFLGEDKTVLQKFIEPARQGWMKTSVSGIIEWLNWVDLPYSPDFLGAWLARSALIAELSKTVSMSRQGTVQYALLDPAGNAVAGQRGPINSFPGYESPVRLAVGSALPGWTIEAFDLAQGNPFRESFRLLGGLVVAGLCVAILLGGSLLLWQAQRDAQDAQRKTTFVANVSHELKTPLTSIRMFAEMLHDGRANDPAKQRRYLETMLNETQRLTRLVNNVLDFSRLERGKRDFQRQSFDIGAAVESIIAGHRERLQGDGLEIEFQAPAEPLSAKADRDAIEQILLNLLDNAVKYAASGERARVSLEAMRDGWKLSVCDFGPGIPASERAQVFESFHRVDDRLTAERPGCGLGLSIAARLAQGMGGQLSLEANAPTGCCFTLTVFQDG